MSNSITYTSTDQLGNKLNKSVSDINANVSGTTLHEFARIANALTTNTLGTVSRVSKVGLDAEKLTPTLSLTPDTFTDFERTKMQAAPYHCIFTINYDGDGKLDFSVEEAEDNLGETVTGKIIRVDDNWQLWLRPLGGNPYGGKFTLTVTASETDNYYAASVTRSRGI